MGERPRRSRWERLLVVTCVAAVLTLFIWDSFRRTAEPIAEMNQDTLLLRGDRQVLRLSDVGSGGALLIETTGPDPGSLCVSSDWSELWWRSGGVWGGSADSGGSSILFADAGGLSVVNRSTGDTEDSIGDIPAGGLVAGGFVLPCPTEGTWCVIRRDGHVRIVTSTPLRQAGSLSVTGGVLDAAFDLATGSVIALNRAGFLEVLDVRGMQVGSTIRLPPTETEYDRVSAGGGFAYVTAYAARSIIEVDVASERIRELDLSVSAGARIAVSSDGTILCVGGVEAGTTRRPVALCRVFERRGLVFTEVARGQLADASHVARVSVSKRARTAYMGAGHRCLRVRF